jgi:hypothetical protein
MTGQDFVALMTTARLDDPAVSLGGLCDLLRQRNPHAVLPPQALHQRLNSPQAVAYRQEGFQLALRAPLAPLYAQLTPGVLAPFSRVFLEERTQCRLHHTLADALKGSGGSARSSPVKLDVIDALLHHRLHALVVTDGRAAEQGHAAAMVPHLRAGALVIRDLGSFSLEALRQIAAKQAWFLSRVSNTVAVYLSAEASEPALALVDHVPRHADQDAVVELAGYLGQPRLPCRVLAYRLPEEVVEPRRRSAYETARKKGRTPTQAYLHWLQFGWYITHVRPEIWAAAVVATVYRIRWPIELLESQPIKSLTWCSIHRCSNDPEHVRQDRVLESPYAPSAIMAWRRDAMKHLTMRDQYLVTDPLQDERLLRALRIILEHQEDHHAGGSLRPSVHSPSATGGDDCQPGASPHRRHSPAGGEPPA